MELGNEIVGILRDAMSNKSVACVMIAGSMFLSCFNPVERIRFLFSVCCL